MRTQKSWPDRGGFTLLELLVVVAILAALAALVIPKLDFVKDQASAATSAAGAAEVMSNLQTYKVAIGTYPSNLDSMLQSVSDTPTFSGTLFQAFPGHLSTPGATSFTTSALTASYSRSLAYAGISKLWDRDPTNTVDPNATLTVSRTITGSSPTDPQNVVTVVSGSSVANSIYPSTSGTIPSGVQLVALGIGGHSDTIGKTMNSAPTNGAAGNMTATGGPEYSRYIAIFAVYESGTGGSAKPATLKAVLDSRYGTVEGNLQNYKNSSPTNQL